MEIDRVHEWWGRVTAQIDNKVADRPLLAFLKRCFDAHFTALGLIGFFATPKGELDCYEYLWDRRNPTKYKHFTVIRRWLRIRRLFRWTIGK